MTQETWLLTGGAGYIGTHIADEFIRAGKSVVIYDSLYQGLESRIVYLRAKHNAEIPFIKADIRDYNELENVIRTHKIDGIVHTAALKAVGESMEKPDEYFEVNFHATTKMLELISQHGIKNFIFSSTAAVYGAPDHSNPIKEDDEKNPISPYGASKLAAEGEVNKFLAIPGNHGTSLRFFNVVGTAAPELLDNSVENLVPIVINKLKAGQPPVIYGTDYPTPDGTGLRDYIHVDDLAQGHLLALRYLEDHPGTLTVNLGAGKPYSVLEMIATFEKVSGKKIPYDLVERRSGDLAEYYANSDLAKTVLSWKAKHGIERMCEDTWRFYSQLGSAQS